MRRADTIRAVPGLAQRVRAALPGAALRTTCLVGFPGETERQFEHLLAHIRRAQYEHLGVFVFSPEEGTAAGARLDAPAPALAAERRARLLAAQRELVARRAAARVGAEDTVLLERPPRGPRGEGRARSTRDAPRIDGAVRVRGLPPNAAAGTFVRVRYTAAAGYDMKARAI